MIFPNPACAGVDEPIAVGGDLSPKRLLAAYRSGIFPWFSEGGLVFWYSPDPRLVLFPAQLYTSRSLRKFMRNCGWHVRFDRNFEQVITCCARVQREHDDHKTWISRDFIEAYTHMHRLGYGHSVEVLDSDGEMIGGLYGLSLGRTFFGESMFSLRSNASKVALQALATVAQNWHFDFIDCQVPSEHLLSLGAQKMNRNEFLHRLETALEAGDRVGRWDIEINVANLA
nr:leucyl/phenylalanyl-tRNA--protein transferase [Desulfurispira natronophila]